MWLAEASRSTCNKCDWLIKAPHNCKGSLVSKNEINFILCGPKIHPIYVTHFMYYWYFWYTMYITRNNIEFTYIMTWFLCYFLHLSSWTNVTNRTNHACTCSWFWLKFWACHYNGLPHRSCQGLVPIGSEILQAGQVTGGQWSPTQASSWTGQGFPIRLVISKAKALSLM